MSGIEKIIQEIDHNASSVCDEILHNANLKAEKIIADAQGSADKILSSEKTKTVSKLEDIAARADSAAALEEKKTILLTKQEIISLMLNNALENMKTLPDDEYFSLIEKMIIKNHSGISGQICFGMKDLGRLPDGFEEKIKDISNGSLSLSKTPVAIDSGFILVYEGIDMNCSFDAIFRSQWEDLSDKASKILF